MNKKISYSISVIIPTYNRRYFLKESIQSVLDQTYQNFEIIIVNDGGDNVKNLIDDFNDDRIRYVCHNKNKGLSAARNTGIKNSNSEYIAFLDDDDIYYQGHLEVLLKKLIKQKYSIAYSNSKKAYQVKLNGIYKTIYKENKLSSAYHPLAIFNKNIAPVNSFMIKRKILIDNLFNEKMKSLEDWELWIRLSINQDFLHIKKTTCEVRFRYDGSTMTSSLSDQYRKDYLFLTKKYKKQFLNKLSEFDVMKKKTFLDNYYLGKGHFQISNFIKSKTYLLKVLRVSGSLTIKEDSCFLLGNIAILLKTGVHNYYFKRACGFFLLNRIRTIDYVEKYALKYFDLGDFNRAKNYFKYIVNKTIPETIKEKSMLYLARIAKEQNNINSQYYYKKFLFIMNKKVNPNEIDLYRKASVYKCIDRFDLALELFKKVSKQTKNEGILVGCYFHIGEIFKKQGDMNKSVDYYQKCLEINSQHVKARINLKEVIKF